MRNFPIQEKQQAQAASEIIANAAQEFGYKKDTAQVKGKGWRAFMSDLQTNEVLLITKYFPTEQEAVEDLAEKESANFLK